MKKAVLLCFFNLFDNLESGKSLEFVRTLFGKDVDAFLFSFKRPMS